MLDIYKLEKLDILHTHYAIPHAVSAYLAKQILKKQNKKINIVTTLHGTDITLVGLEPSFKELVKFSIEESCGVTAVSNFLKEETYKHYNVNKEIKVIYNFVDTNIYNPKIKNNSLRNRFANENEKILVHVSNFRPVKRTLDIIEIFNILQKKLPVKLLLIGDGPDLTKCEELARKYNILDKIYFLGKQTAIAELISIGDVLILTSQTESFGLAALEALACGVPVVCSNVGGLPEVVIDRINGILVEVGKILNFVSAIEEILTNSIFYNLLSQNAIDIVNQKFRADLITRQYEEYYQHIIDNCNE